MFLGGEYSHNIDGKRRLFIPVRLRGDQKRFILARGLEGCLSLYTMSAWEKLSHKLEVLPVTDKAQARAFRRLLISGAVPAEIDAQGRLLVPESLGTFAGIRRDVIVIGVDTHIEIWAADRWRKYRQVAEKTFSKISDQIEI
ncbi:MAG TPA: division/cell wall cluster transcriptional repressor MraZ [Elusimicrobiota bacterium]|nr:division/cell wall cluster transcriptional repressor MraZ [Elusimicrobiota bacterium]